MSYYQECIESIEQILEQTIPSSGIEGAFGRFYVEEWLDKPFNELLDPSYDDTRIQIDKMDHVFSVVLAYKYGIQKGYIPKYAESLFQDIVSSGYLEKFTMLLLPEDLVLFKKDINLVLQYKAANI